MRRRRGVTGWGSAGEFAVVEADSISEGRKVRGRRGKGEMDKLAREREFLAIDNQVRFC